MHVVPFNTLCSRKSLCRCVNRKLVFLTWQAIKLQVTNLIFGCSQRRDNITGGVTRYVVMKKAVCSIFWFCFLFYTFILLWVVGTSYVLRKIIKYKVIVIHFCYYSIWPLLKLLADRSILPWLKKKENISIYAVI